MVLVPPECRSIPQLQQELQFVISARSLLGLTGAWMCLLSLATVGLSSALSILKLLYLSIQEVPGVLS